MTSPEPTEWGLAALDVVARLLLTDLRGDLLLFDHTARLHQQVQQVWLAQNLSAESIADGSERTEDPATPPIHHINPLGAASHAHERLKLGELVANVVALERVDTVFLNDPVAIAADIDWPGQQQGFGDSSMAVTRLLSLCRDRVPNRVFALPAPGQESELLSCQDFFALGFQRVTWPMAANAPLPQLYVYSLQGYKTVPDWLNSKYWANPERWHLAE